MQEYWRKTPSETLWDFGQTRTSPRETSENCTDLKSHCFYRSAVWPQIRSMLTRIATCIHTFFASILRRAIRTHQGRHNWNSRNSGRWSRQRRLYLSTVNRNGGGGVHVVSPRAWVVLPLHLRLRLLQNYLNGSEDLSIWGAMCSPQSCHSSAQAIWYHISHFESYHPAEERTISNVYPETNIMERRGGCQGATCSTESSTCCE